MAMVFHLPCSALSRIWTPMPRFACNQALPTTRLHKTARRRSETSEADGDRAEPCVQTRTGISSGHWKTVRWKKAGPEEVRAPHRAGREATCDEPTWRVKEFLFTSIPIDERIGEAGHLYCISSKKCWSAGAIADMPGWPAVSWLVNMFDRSKPFGSLSSAW